MVDFTQKNILFLAFSTMKRAVVRCGRNKVYIAIHWRVTLQLLLSILNTIFQTLKYSWLKNTKVEKEHGEIFFLICIFTVLQVLMYSLQFTRFTHKQRSVQSSITGLPWWRSGWESACQCRGHGFEPWSGKIPHAAEQLSLWATITEPARLEPVLHNKRGRNNERPAHRDEEWPPLAATGEGPRTETKTQHTQK